MSWYRIGPNQVFIDDVLVVRQSFNEHLRNLRAVFTRLSPAGLNLKPSKCKLVQRRVEFLGWTLCDLKPGDFSRPRKDDDHYRIATTNTPMCIAGIPKTNILRLTSYYRRFVPCFSAVTQPLYTLTHKDVPFQWSEECEAAFMHVSDEVTSIGLASVTASPSALWANCMFCFR